MTTVAIYSRLSLDSTGGFQTATARQREACRAFASAREWKVGSEYEDVDASAANPRVQRPGLEQLLLAVERGEVEGVLVWKLDRLVRRPAQFEAIWQRLEARGAFLASATEPVDSSNPIGLAIVRMLVTFASLETATQSLRLKAKWREQALAGIPHNKAACFGHTADRKAVIPHEAALIVEAAERVASGEPASAVVADWRARGVPAARGGEWHSTVLRQMLRSPRLVGDLAYRGEVVATGCFARILDEDLSGRLALRLADSSRRKWAKHGPYLLTGVLHCGICGCGMRGSGRKGRRKGAYACNVSPTGCGRVSVTADLIDSYVIEAALPRLSRPRRPLDANRHEKAKALAAASRAYYRDGSITRTAFYAIRRAAVEEPANYAATSRSAWNNASLPDKRELLRSVLADVVIHKAKPSGWDFDTGRVELWWRGEAAGNRA